MQLRGTRLCLDCEELHREDRCPACASDAFAYLTRWVKVTERRDAPRPIIQTAPAKPPAQPGVSRWLTRGAAGLVLVATSRWLWKSTRPMEWSEAPTSRTDKRPRPRLDDDD